MPKRVDHGAVTAETAMALPLVAMFTLAMAWMVCVGITQVRALDAAREVARAAARSETGGQAVALGRQVAPLGSRISVRRGPDTVVATVVSPVRGPAGIIGRLASTHVTGRAVAAAEPGP